MLIEFSVIWMLLLHSDLVKCDADPNLHKDPDSKDAKEDDYYVKDDRKLRWMTMTSDYWKNHRNLPNNYYNYVLAKAGRDTRQGASNNEAYFAEPASERYEQSMSPSAIQITALPAGYPGYNGINGINNGQFNPDPINPDQVGVGWNPYQRFPVFVINKSGGKSEKFWLLPLLLLLGAPLLLGAIFIPLTIQCVFFFFTLLRNLGFLLPLISGMTGNNGLNGMNPIIPATG